MSDQAEVESEAGHPLPVLPSPPSAPGLDRTLCRLSWCLAALLAVLVLVAGLLYLGVARGVERLVRVRVVDTHVERSASELTTLLATVRLEIENRTPISLILSGLSYSVKVGPSEVCSGDWQPDATTLIRARGATTVDVKMHMDLARLGGAVLQALASDRPGVTVSARLRLRTWIGPLTVPVTTRAALPSVLATPSPEGP
ncbi:MAG TPA: LEA type 2 family protein [Thermoanaerobaculaceae bacterium]|nr:LEA type 2 family protein [Thermoanaerobaculaceae bacterium]